MKILNVCLSQSEGGLEFCVSKFAKKFEQEGHDSIVMCLEKSIIHQQAVNLQLPVVLLRSKNIFINFFKLKKWIREHQPDALISHRSFEMKLFVLQNFLYPQIKLIHFLHTLIKHHKKDLIHRFFHQHINELVVFTEIQKQNALQYLPINTSQLRLIPHYVDTTIFKSELIKNNNVLPFVSKKKMTIGCIGRFDLKKGQIELIEAARLLKNKGLDFELIFIGKDTVNETGTKQKCQNLVANYDLTKQVSFFEHQNSISEYYKKFDVFVMPSHEETFGMVLIEAMATGCLCVSTLAGGPIEILNYGQAGVLVEAKSVNQLALALNDIILYPKNYEQLRKCGHHRAHSVYAQSNLNISEILLSS